MQRPASPRDYARLPAVVQRRVDKALRLLEADLQHPSLRVKKMRGIENRWEARVSLKYRFTFTLAGDVCQLLQVGAHDILR